MSYTIYLQIEQEDNSTPTRVAVLGTSNTQDEADALFDIATEAWRERTGKDVEELDE